MKLELKHLASYLPHELEVLDSQQNKVRVIGIKNETYFIENGNTYAYGDIQECKPIIRPLSDLTKEIELNGEKFVPLVELFENQLPPEFVNRSKILSTDRINYYEVGYREHKHDFSFRFNKNILRNDYMLLEKLFEWHFDVFGLIPQGLAIDINTLNQ